MSATIHKSGKIAFSLKEDERAAIELAIRNALYFNAGEMQPAIYWLLLESIQQMMQPATRIALRKSAFFAVFSDVVIQYIDEPTQICLKEAIALKKNMEKQIINEFYHQFS